MAISFSLLAQENRFDADTTLLIVSDTLQLDTITRQSLRVSANAIDQQVTYSAAGQVRRDIANKRVILTDKAVVRYGDIEIQADSMVFNMDNNLLYAIGRSDTAGNINGSPVFKEGSNEFKADELTYNFKTKKALVKNITTKQDEGLIHSEYTKLLEDGTSNISQSSYSTCDLLPPHFYINMPKARVYPGEKIVSGPANLVVEGIPLPLIIPFGYFPVNSRYSSSGILFPTYGQERARGYSFKEMGYYFSINDYVDLSVKGDIYTNGTWLANVTSNYNKLYKYSGNLNFNYANNISGHKGLNDYSQATNYRLGWTFNQDPKASPGSRFSASVNMSSSNYDKQNSYSPMDRSTTTRQSSISYSKSWAGTPFSLSTSMNHSQNVKNKSVDVNLPKVSFNMARIYPLKMGRQAGATKWYQDLQLQYSASLDNQISTTDSLLFTKETVNNMRNGFKHDIPLSLPIQPFKNFNISPSLTYSGVLYTQKIEKRWDDASKTVIKDTIRQASYGHSIKPTLSAGYNPQIFGTFAFINPNSRVQAIRHVMRPSVGFSFTPEVFGSDLWRTVQSDTTGAQHETYSIFDGGIYGTPTPMPSSTKRSGSVSFGLNNLFEAKVLSKRDTTGVSKKINLIDNIGATTNYNIFADSMRWSDVSMNARTKLMNNVNVNVTSNFSMYAIDSAGRQINQLFYNTNNKLLRFKDLNINTGIDFSLDQLIKKLSGQSETSTNTTNSTNAGFDEEGDGHHHHDDHLSNGNSGYQDFNMPWSLNVRYSFDFRYEKAVQKSTIRQTLSMNGNVTITKNLTANITTGYDFDYKQITTTQIGIQRDLHCWTMGFNWIPNGSMQSWNFTIRAKASVLSDLKYDRRKDFHDRY